MIDRIDNRCRFDVVVVAAKSDEQRHINSVFRHYFGEPVVFANGLLYEIRKHREGFSPFTVYLTTCGGQGNVSAGIVVSEVKFLYHPSLIFFTGTAGSLNPTKLRLGDVVLPKAVHARLYERAVEKGQSDYNQYASSGKRLESFHENTILIPRPDTMNVDRSSLAIIGRLDFAKLNKKIRSSYQGCLVKDIPIPNGFDLTGRDIEIVDDIEIFTCDLLVNSNPYRDFLVGEIHTKASAIDTESFGHLKAIVAQRNDIAPYSIIVRGISDYAGRRTETQKDPRWGEVANRNAAITTAEIIFQQLGLTNMVLELAA